jgi:hypothetical protein
VDDIDTLRNEALQLLALADRETSPTEQLRIRRRAAWMIELTDRIEQRGSMIMTEQPAIRTVLTLVR